MVKRADTSRPVRLRDVAAAAGVNPSIASRVLNDDPTLSARPETRARVRDAASALGYTPNALARGLKLQSTTTLALAAPNPAALLSADLIQGAERRAAGYGYVMLLADTADFQGDGSARRRLLLERRVDGLVVAGLGAAGDLVADLDANRVPYVLIDRRPGLGGLSVCADDAAAAALAVEHLVALGHRRLAYVSSHATSDASERRLGGYREALARLGLESGGEITGAAATEDGGFAAAGAVSGGRRAPTALVVASIAQAVGAMAALRGTGRQLPRDVSLVALEDAPMAAYLDPPLTTVRMPVREVAETAVDQLVRRVRGEAAEDVVVPTAPELVERGSTAPPARAA